MIERQLIKLSRPPPLSELAEKVTATQTEVNQTLESTFNGRTENYSYPFKEAIFNHIKSVRKDTDRLRLKILSFRIWCEQYNLCNEIIFHQSISGLVVKSIVAIDGPRVRFAADA
ncbi:uncharacterized protein K452DRAFT_105569 [Aplosporella prunicola CBS 121167]|uniref:Uncharacterized protein n=1 Tax=Aplosporella prunicola CBS 121167 TaxID=1176127 RepID=A0A6A6BQQ8_9PEZI|nr:uncharacterized protein K452DRAFT_105569 [Aplosporella prunicola CBS 121167]KAF2146088.1 hypothetical protein K452DRAFT_105569 [Aplosporella prunicola CBS 121167]